MQVLYCLSNHPYVGVQEKGNAKKKHTTATVKAKQCNKHAYILIGCSWFGA
jgi:hypothetical protein